MADPISSLRTGRDLRVLVAGINWPPETFILRLMVGLTSEGLEITVGAPTFERPDGRPHSQLHWQPMPTWDGPILLRLVRLGFAMIGAYRRSPTRARRLLRAASVHRTLVDCMATANRLLPFARGDWDVIYFPWNSAAVHCLPAFSLGIPVVISCRGSQINVAPTNPERSSFKNSVHETLRGATAVHCVSRDTQEKAIALGLDAHKSMVIHPGVDPEKFQPAANSDRSSEILRIVNVGTLIWMKGHEYLLQAFRMLLDCGVSARLDIVGDGPDRQRIFYTIQDLSLGPFVTLHGRRTSSEIIGLLQRADVFAFASVTEGLPNAVLEAMACGLPVVTSNCGGVAEAVADGVEGFVVPVRDPRAMAVRLEHVARDPVLRRIMGAAARQRILREFTLDRQVKVFAELLRQTVIRFPTRAKAYESPSRSTYASNARPVTLVD